MDGADTTDRELGGATFSNFNVDTIQEVQSSSGVMPAEIGHGAAGFNNVITKSGTNEVHGSAFEFVRNANSVFAETDLLKQLKEREAPIAGRSKTRSHAFPFPFFASTCSRFALSSVWRLSGFPDDGPFEEQACSAVSAT